MKTMKIFSLAVSLIFGSLLIFGQIDNWLARAVCLLFFAASFGFFVLAIADEGNADINKSLEETQK